MVSLLFLILPLLGVVVVAVVLVVVFVKRSQDKKHDEFHKRKF